VALFGFVAIMFLSVVHELAPTLVVFLCGWRLARVVGKSQHVYVIASIEAVFAVSMLMG
jgi:hypothetical protein